MLRSLHFIHCSPIKKNCWWFSCLNWCIFRAEFFNLDGSKTFPGVMWLWVARKKFDPIGSTVLTFIGYKQTYRKAKCIYRNTEVKGSLKSAVYKYLINDKLLRPEYIMSILVWFPSTEVYCIPRFLVAGINMCWTRCQLWGVKKIKITPFSEGTQFFMI